jgi:hypothetical protein
MVAIIMDFFKVIPKDIRNIIGRFIKEDKKRRTLICALSYYIEGIRITNAKLKPWDYNNNYVTKTTSKWSNGGVVDKNLVVVVYSDYIKPNKRVISLDYIYMTPMNIYDLEKIRHRFKEYEIID